MFRRWDTQHQLIGQLENTEFWLPKASHAIEVIDGCPARFDRLRVAQERWVDAHGTKTLTTTSLLSFSIRKECAFVKRHSAFPDVCCRWPVGYLVASGRMAEDDAAWVQYIERQTYY
jgi:hypothetical protein